MAGTRAHEVLLEFLKAPHEKADLVALLGEEALGEAATSKGSPRESESPWSLRRRQSASELLPATNIYNGRTRRRALVGGKDDPMLPFLARKLRLLSGGADDEAVALQRLIALLPDADWFPGGEIEDCLVRNFA